MPRTKKHKPQQAPQDPMTAAILGGLRPHMDASVRAQMTAMLVAMLGAVAPELEVRARQTEPVATTPVTGNGTGGKADKAA